MMAGEERKLGRDGWGWARKLLGRRESLGSPEQIQFTRSFDWLSHLAVRRLHKSWSSIAH